MRKLVCSIALVVFLIAGCATPAVNISVKNVGATPLKNIEVNYPGGSFGIADLQPGQTFNYALRPTAAGNMTVSWPEKNGRPFKGPGPKLDKGYKGSVQFEVGEEKFSFYSDARPK